MSKYKDQIFNFLRTVDLRAEKILSIGSQEDDRRYFKSVKCNEWLSLDSDQNFKPTILYDLNQPIVSPEGDMLISDSFGDYFDCIIMLNVWEYIWNAPAAHDNLHFFLKSGGQLVTNYPFVYPLHEPKGTDFLRYTPEGALRLLFEAGFSVVANRPIYGNERLTEYYHQDGLKARAGFDHQTTGTIIIAKKI